MGSLGISVSSRCDKSVILILFITSYVPEFIDVNPRDVSLAREHTVRP